MKYTIVMTTSKTIAALLGPTLIASAASIFINLNMWPALVDQAFHNPALVFVTGYPLFVAGLAIVYFHNQVAAKLASGGDRSRMACAGIRPFTNTFPNTASWNRDKRHSNHWRNAYSGACDLSSWRILIVQSVQERITPALLALADEGIE